MSKIWDAVIVGAGPAGSTAAKFLAEAGLEVLLIDKEKFPREKTCGGALFSKVYKEFQYIKKYQKEFIERECYNLKLVHMGKEYNLNTSNPSILTTRKRFDWLLYKLAKMSGASILTDTVVNFKVKENAIIKTKKGKQIRTKMVIGADGVRSVVAKDAKLNLGWAPSQLGTLCIGKVRLNKKEVDKIVDADNAMYIRSIPPWVGYGWVFALRNSLNIGFVNKMEQGGTPIVFNKFVKIIKSEGVIPEKIKIENLTAVVLPYHSPLSQTYSKSILLCGDAGGFVNPINAEGIPYAMITGKLAAQIAISALDNADFSKEFLSKYQLMWKSKIGEDFRFGLSLRRFAFSPALSVFSWIPGVDNVLSDYFVNSVIDIRAKILQQIFNYF